MAIARKEAQGMERKWLLCSVTLGQFPSEYAISGVQYNGRSFSLFAPRETVLLTAPDKAEGLVEVQVMDNKEDLVLVRLPAHTFENGQYVTVRASELQEAPQSTRAGA
jgi:hypothetical protein